MFSFLYGLISKRQRVESSEENENDITRTSHSFIENDASDVMIVDDADIDCIVGDVTDEFFYNGSENDVESVERRQRILRLADKVGDIYFPQLLKQVESIPIVGLYVGALLGIYELCQGVESNKEKYKELLEMVQEGSRLIVEFQSYCQSPNGSKSKNKESNLSEQDRLFEVFESLCKSIKEAETMVRSIEGRMTEQSVLHSVVGYFMQNNDKEYLESKTECLQKALANFRRDLTIVSEKLLMKQLSIESQLRERLCVIDVDYHAKRNTASYLPQSRSWIFEEVDAWLQGKNHREKIFWLQATAGMGKTVFAAKLSEMLAQQNRLLGKAFFRFNEHRASNPVIILKTIIYQIVLQYPKVQDWMLEQLMKGNGDEDTVRYVFEEYLVKLVEKLEELGCISATAPVVIVLDALDECGFDRSDSRKSLLSVLSTCSIPPYLKLFVTGRPEPDIMRALERYSYIISETDSRHQMDLQAYIAKSIDVLFDYAGWEVGMKAACCEILYEKSELKFIYTALAIDHLKQFIQQQSCDLPSSAFSMEEFVSCLEELPQGLGGCYQSSIKKLLLHLSENDLGKRFLQLMVASPEPLSEKLVRYFLDMDSSSFDQRWQFLLKHVQSVFPLVEVVDSGGARTKKFYPYHKSVIDWLQERDESEDLCVDGVEGKQCICYHLMRSFCLNITYKGEPINDIRVHVVDMDQLQIGYMEEDVKKIKGNELMVYALKHIHYLVRECCSVQNEWYRILHCWWTALSPLQMMFAVLLPLEVYHMVSDVLLWMKDMNNVIFSQQQQQQQQRLIFDLHHVQWMSRFLCPAVSKVQCWYRELPQQILMRIQEEQTSDRLRALRCECRSWVQHKGGVEYIRGPVANSSTAQQLVLKGHTAEVEALIVLQDGRLVSGSYDNTVRIWNIETGECERVLKGHTGGIGALAVLQDDRLIISSSRDKTVRIWNTETGECEKVLKGHTDWIETLAVLEDGRLVSGSGDNTVRIWNAETGACERVLKGHTGGIETLAVLQDGRLVSGSMDNTVRIWNTETGECEKILEGHTSLIGALAVLQDGRLVSGSGDKTVRIWNTETGESERALEGHTGGINALTVLQDGRLVSGSRDNTVRIWNTKTGESDRALEGHTDMIKALTVLKDDRVVSGSMDKTVRIWNTETGECERVLKGHTGRIVALAVLENGRLVSGSGDDETVRIWNTETGECERVLKGHSGRIVALAVLEDGRLVCGCWNKTIRIWNTETGECEKVLEGHSGGIKALSVLFNKSNTKFGMFHRLLPFYFENTVTCSCLINDLCCLTVSNHLLWYKVHVGINLNEQVK